MSAFKSSIQPTIQPSNLATVGRTFYESIRATIKSPLFATVRPTFKTTKHNAKWPAIDAPDD
jgi:hypothetical protein